ncbi:MAG: VacJ family lipoprotein, partial [Alphaproteobacteria bacterium]|nr:VacJ family lipoprotein [Alphaproteobacteria bacterium]
MLGVNGPLSGCASTQNQLDENSVQSTENDPLEPVNRGIFSFNQAADKAVLKPVAKGYRWLVPEFIR